MLSWKGCVVREHTVGRKLSTGRDSVSFLELDFPWQCFPFPELEPRIRDKFPCLSWNWNQEQVKLFHSAVVVRVLSPSSMQVVQKGGEFIRCYLLRSMFGFVFGAVKKEIKSWRVCLSLEYTCPTPFPCLRERTWWKVNTTREGSPLYTPTKSNLQQWNQRGTLEPSSKRSKSAACVSWFSAPYLKLLSIYTTPCCWGSSSPELIRSQHGSRF